VDNDGTLYVTGATSSGSKYYSLNSCYTCTTPDPYFDYVDTAYNFGVPSFSYITVDSSSLNIATYSYKITNAATGAYTRKLVDTYTLTK